VAAGLSATFWINWIKRQFTNGIGGKVISKCQVRVVLPILMLFGSVLSLSIQATAGATSAHHATAAGPKKGGIVTISSGGATSLDPVSPLWPTGSSYGFQIYGSLFDPGGTSGATLIPDLATGYTYSDGFKTLTVTLRHGVKFQDNTSFNSQAVAYNIMRDAGTTSNVSQYFTSLTSVTTPNKYTVVLHLAQPDTNMAYILADTNAAYIGSPSAIQSEGANFGLMPIGAGPFKLVSNNPTVEQDLVAWPGYYDAKHRYLSELKYLNVGTDANVVYNDLATNAIQSFTAIGISDPPNVLQEASSNSSITLTKGADLVYTFLVINTLKAPFNNPIAREAVAYCTDRGSIATDIQGGWANPTPILAGTSEQYYPDSGGTVKGKLAAANKLEPYQYNVAMGTQLVKSLPGGTLNFTFNVLAGQTATIATALAQQWALCGINATQNIVQFGQAFAAYATGNYQISTQISGGIYDPAIYVPLYSVPTAADDKYGFNSPTVTNLLTATNFDANPALLQSDWTRIWSTEDKLAVNIPVISGDNLYFNSKCLKGLGFIEAGVIFKNAYYTC
jgi:peptide/nickel transport system substrate-binding protein